MRVCLKNIHKTNLQDDLSVIKSFCSMLQDELKLSNDVHINFVTERDTPMTTGVRMPNHEIYVLSKNRLLIDVLRTLAHEWVHEYQHQKMGVSDKEPIQDIGGPEENMASILASVFLKKFQKRHPKFTNKLFGEQITRNKKQINELSPDSSGFQELYDLVAQHPEALKYLKFGSLKSLKQYLLDSDYSEFQQIKREVEFYIDREHEIERVVQYLNREEGMNVSVQDINKAFDNAREITLPVKVLNKLENTECNTINKGEMNKVIAIAKKYNKQSPLELEKVLESGDYDRPLILKFKNRYHLVAGNTRLCTAMAMGMKPKVLIGEI
jgi:hypothetical protein